MRQLGVAKWQGSDSRKARELLRPVVEAGGAKCYRCGKPIRQLPSGEFERWHPDHVVERALGGGNGIENLAPSHGRCNESAGGKMGAAITNANKRRDRDSLTRRSSPRLPPAQFPSTPQSGTPALPAGLPLAPPDDLPDVAAEPLILSAIPADTDLSEAHAGAKWLGLPLTPQGEQIASVMQARNLSGFPLYETVCIEAPRRSTKTTAALATILGRCLDRPGYLVASTAQDGTRASAKLVEVMTTLRHAGFEDEGHKLYFSNGKERILFANGSEWRALPPDPSAFRSAAYDLVLIDESGELPPEKASALMAGILPTQDTRPDSQIIVAGTPGETRAGLLWDTLRDLHAGAPGVGGCIYAAPEGSTFVDLSDPNGDGLPVVDWELLLATHPGISSGLTTAAKVYSRLAKMGVQKWSAEYLCSWPLSAGAGALDVTAWRDCETDDDPERPEDAALAWDCDPGGTAAAVVAAWRDEAGRAHLEVIDADEGTEWVPAALQEAQAAQRGASVYDAIGANLDVADRLGRPPFRVRSTPLKMRDTIGAAARIDREIRHRRVVQYGDAVMSQAVENAGWRPAANARLFLRTPWSCALVAASEALWAYDQRQGSGRRRRIVSSASAGAGALRAVS